MTSATDAIVGRSANGTAVIKALMKKWSEKSHIRSSYLSCSNFEEHDDIADLKFSSLKAAFGKT